MDWQLFANFVNPMEFDQINIYRMTHIENIPHILRYGLTHKNSSNSNPDYKDIGDQQIISSRTHKEVKITNGEGPLSNQWITIGDFIPFYFGVRMPTLYVANLGGNFVKQATKNENIVYLVCSVKQIAASGQFTFYFSNGSAVSNLSSFYDQRKVNDLPQILDWDAVKSQKWDGIENLERKWRKQAEFLIREDVPFEFVFGIVCYNENAATRLIEMGVDPTMIKIHQNSYF